MNRIERNYVLESVEKDPMRHYLGISENNSWICHMLFGANYDAKQVYITSLNPKHLNCGLGQYNIRQVVKSI